MNRKQKRNATWLIGFATYSTAYFSLESMVPVNSDSVAKEWLVVGLSLFIAGVVVFSLAGFFTRND
jgi:hypothetical protein